MVPFVCYSYYTYTYPLLSQQIFPNSMFQIIHNFPSARKRKQFWETPEKVPCSASQFHRKTLSAGCPQRTDFCLPWKFPEKLEKGTWFNSQKAKIFSDKMCTNTKQLYFFAFVFLTYLITFITRQFKYFLLFLPFLPKNTVELRCARLPFFLWDYDTRS